MKTTILRVDSRDKHFHNFGGTMTFADEINFDSGLTNPIEQPTETDCTSIADTDVGGDQEKQIYDYDDLWILTPNKTSSGVDPRDTLGAMIKSGLLRKGTQTRDKLWVSYVRGDTSPTYSSIDAFDRVRGCMTLCNSSITVASGWYKNWFVGSNGIMPIGVNQVSGHCYKISGWKQVNGEPMFIIKAWLGFTMYMPRATFNDAISKSGCGAYMPSTQAIDLIEKRSLWTWLSDLITNVLLACKEFLILEPMIITTPASPVPPIEPTPTTPPQYLWNNAVNSEHSVRVICDEQGLNLEDKNIITACIHQESNFNNNAVNHNKNAEGIITSTDWGICQINDYYNIGAGLAFKTVQEVLDNPDKAVKFMIACFKAGNLKYWVSYSSGAYKKYLNM